MLLLNLHIDIDKKYVERIYKKKGTFIYLCMTNLESMSVIL